METWFNSSLISRHPSKIFWQRGSLSLLCHKTSRLLSETFKTVEIRTHFSQIWSWSLVEALHWCYFRKLTKEGKKNIIVICPGFSSDCVETLEEISIQGKSFINSGGNNFDVVPCLNDSEDHINLLEQLTKNFYKWMHILHLKPYI